MLFEPDWEKYDITYNSKGEPQLTIHPFEVHKQSKQPRGKPTIKGWSKAGGPPNSKEYFDKRNKEIRLQRLQKIKNLPQLSWEERHANWLQMKEKTKYHFKAKQLEYFDDPHLLAAYEAINKPPPGIFDVYYKDYPDLYPAPPNYRWS